MLSENLAIAAIILLLPAILSLLGIPAGMVEMEGKGGLSGKVVAGMLALPVLVIGLFIASVCTRG